MAPCVTTPAQSKAIAEACIAEALDGGVGSTSSFAFVNNADGSVTITHDDGDGTVVSGTTGAPSVELFGLGEVLPANAVPIVIDGVTYGPGDTLPADLVGCVMVDEVTGKSFLGGVAGGDGYHEYITIAADGTATDKNGNVIPAADVPAGAGPGSTIGVDFDADGNVLTVECIPDTMFVDWTGTDDCIPGASNPKWNEVTCDPFGSLWKSAKGSTTFARCQTEPDFFIHNNNETTTAADFADMEFDVVGTGVRHDFFRHEHSYTNTTCCPQWVWARIRWDGTGFEIVDHTDGTSIRFSFTLANSSGANRISPQSFNLVSVADSAHSEIDNPRDFHVNAVSADVGGFVAPGATWTFDLVMQGIYAGGSSNPGAVIRQNVSTEENKTLVTFDARKAPLPAADWYVTPVSD